MSGRIVGEVLDHAPDDLRPVDFRVLIALAEDAFDSDRTARRRCSAEELAYRARSTPGSVRQSLKRLRDRGLIRPVHARVGPGKQQNWIVAQLSSYHREGARIIPISRDSQRSHDPPPEHVTPRGHT